ncbi:MAG: hypothetical protein WKF96_15155 [Solirubrobacteraceae bacterium]
MSVERQFGRPPLPRTLDAYRLYLDFVAARNARIRNWCDKPKGVGAIQ